MIEKPKEARADLEVQEQDKSPFNLIQEDYTHNPWRMMICCIFLNQTTNIQVRKILSSFFGRFPNEHSIDETHVQEIAEMIKPLGLYNRRANTIVKFCKGWICGFKSVDSLYGLGKYASDSWEIFLNKNYDIQVTDKKLKMYLDWKNTF